MIKKYPYKFTKHTVDMYCFHAEGAAYWADIVIDSPPGAQTGRITIASDFGNWQYFWGACGKPFRKFLASCDRDYVAKNFGAHRYFDIAGTVACYREMAESHKDVDWLYEKIMHEIKFLEMFSGRQAEFEIQLMRDCPHVLSMYDGSPDLCYRLDPGFENFWEHIWPLLLDEFKKEDATLPDSEYFLEHPLTLEYLMDNTNLDKVFATGVTTERGLHPDQIRWVAKTGGGNDWAIYYHLKFMDIDFIKREGDKVVTDAIIRKLVSCTDEALLRYRR